MGVEPGLLIGFRSAENIRASGHVPREQAGDMTCTQPQHCIRFFLQSGRRPDMAHQDMPILHCNGSDHQLRTS
jgi:hypothetical protein